MFSEFLLFQNLLTMLVVCTICTNSEASTKYGVKVFSQPTHTYGVKYSEPKILPRPQQAKYRPVSNPYQTHEPTYELVYEPVPRNAPEYPPAHVKVIHVHHYHEKHPY